MTVKERLPVYFINFVFKLIVIEKSIIAFAYLLMFWPVRHSEILKDNELQYGQRADVISYLKQ